MTDRHEIAVAANQIPGWMTWAEMLHLMDLMAGSRAHVDVGTYCGKSLWLAAMVMHPEGRLIAVDHGQYATGSMADWHGPLPDWPWSILDLTIAAIHHHRPSLSVSVLKMPSLDAAESTGTGELTSCYIDADHAYESIRSDIAAWRTRVANGGTIAGHDYDRERFPGVVQAVQEAFGGRAKVSPKHRIWSFRQV